MTILTEQYKIRSVEDSDVSMLPSYLRIDAEIKSKLNKTLFNIGKKLAETGDTSLSKTDLDIKDKVRVSAIITVGSPKKGTPNKGTSCDPFMTQNLENGK